MRQSAQSQWPRVVKVIAVLWAVLVKAEIVFALCYYASHITRW